jgi:hypothetical protein
MRKGIGGHPDLYTKPDMERWHEVATARLKRICLPNRVSEPASVAERMLAKFDAFRFERFKDNKFLVFFPCEDAFRSPGDRD